jgi:hypothetical protein
MSESADDPVRAAQAARAREELNRRLQTSVDLGRAVAFQPSSRASLGRWNLFLAWLGAAILAAIVAVNLIF